MKKIQIILALCFTFLGMPIAQATTAQARVSSTEITLDEMVRLQVSIDKRVSSDAFDTSDLQSDFIVGTPSMSSSYQNINGHSSVQTKWQVLVAPKKAGLLRIPEFNIDGYKTQPIVLNVKKTQQNTSGNIANKDIIVQSQLDKASLYIGESTQLHVKIYIGEKLTHLRLQPPVIDGVSIKKLTTKKSYYRDQAGKNYTVFDLSYQVTPHKVGEFVLPGALVTGDKVSGRQSIFGTSSLSLPIQKQSPAQKLSVLAKPSQIQGFWLPTTQFTMTQKWQPKASQLDDHSVKVGTSIERNIEMRAVGVDEIQMPQIQLNYPDSVKIYADKPTFKQEGNEMVMRLKQVIIPRKKGEIHLPSLDVNWFNTLTKQQQSAHLDGLKLQVIADPDQVLNTEVESVKPLTKAISAPVEEKKPQMMTQVVNKTPMYWIIATFILALLWLSTLFFIFWQKKKGITSHQKVGEVKTCHALDIAYCEQLLKKKQHMQLVSYWRTRDKTAYDPKIIGQIEEELVLMQACDYGQQKNTWTMQPLMHLFKQLHQTTQSTEKAPLANL